MSSNASASSEPSTAVMRSLQDLARTSPDLAILQLEYRGITRLQPLLPILEQLTSLGELSLAGNSIADLPQDLSALEMLAVLDLTNNPLRDLDGVLQALATLPSLAVLRLDLPTASDHRRVTRALPYLQVLNGSPTGTDETEEAELESQSGGSSTRQASTTDSRVQNQGQRQPRRQQQLQQQQQQHQEHEQESAQPPQQQQQQQARQGANEPGYHGITKDTLTSVARIYGAIEELFKENASAGAGAYDEAQAEEDFDRHVTNTLDALGAQKARAKKNAALAATHVSNAQRDLYDICEQKLLEYVDSTVNDGQRLRTVLQMLFEARASVAAEAAAARASLALQSERSERELEQVLQTAEMLEQQVDVETMKNKILTEAFDKERDRLMRRAAQAAAAAGSSSSGHHARPSHQAIVATSDPSMSMSSTTAAWNAGNSGGTALAAGGSDAGNGGAEVRDMTLKQLLDVISALYESKKEFDAKCEEARQPKETMQQHLITYLRKQYGLPSLLERHAVSIMHATKKYARRNNDVMVFKKIMDSEFEEAFRFVQASLKKSVKSLLRAYLRDTHKRKSTAFVDNLLKKRTSKAGLIYEKEWTDILKYMYNVEDAMNLTCMLKEMADQQEAEEAANRRKPARGQPRQLLQQQSQAEDASTKYAIRYLDFEQVLLNFQLKGHEKFLRQFCQIFREYDPEARGLLDEKDFRLLVLKINPNKTHDELDHLVATVDPYNNQLITFSQVVNVLQDEIEILASGLHPNFPANEFN